MPLPGTRYTRLAWPEHGGAAVDRELRLTLQHQEHLVSDVVRMAAAELVWLEAHDARANLRSNEQVSHVAG
jgi:hypothetical protein